MASPSGSDVVAEDADIKNATEWMELDRSEQVCMTLCTTAVYLEVGVLAIVELSVVRTCNIDRAHLRRTEHLFFRCTCM